MATDADVRRALIEAAEAVMHLDLPAADENDLVERFNQATGSYKDKAKEAIKRKANLTESEYQTRKFASDNSDRKIKDLEDALDNWKPGS